MTAVRSSDAVDHLVLGAATLEEGIAWAERTLGATPQPGGRHPQWGTHNALLSLGHGAYLEILARDPQASECPAAPLFGLDTVAAGPRLVTWMSRATNVEGIASAALRAGHDAGRVRGGTRMRPDGTELSWQVAVPPMRAMGGVIPWPIDWGWSEHPSRAAARGGTLAWLEVEHPEPARVRVILDAMQCEGVGVTEAREPAIVAGIACARGVVVVR